MNSSRLHDFRIERLSGYALGVLLLTGGASAQTQLQTQSGPSAGYGKALANIGDVDGDGFDDYVVGHPLKSDPPPSTMSARGMAEVRSGATGALIHTVLGTSVNQQLGYSVAGVGDVNGDGIPDFAVGSPSLNQACVSSTGVICTPTGFVDVYSGAPGPLTPLFHIAGRFAGDNYGTSLAGGYDWNGDGHNDLVIGGTQNPAFGGLGWGVVGVYSLVPGTSSGTQFISQSGLVFGSFFGRSVDIGDVTGDGVPDIAVGAPSEFTGTVSPGAAYVFDIATLSPIQLYHFSNSSAPSPTNLDWFGQEVRITSDVNYDVSAEVLVGAPGYQSGTGMVHMFSGANGSEIMQLIGTAAGDQFGSSLANLGDVIPSASGLDDFAIAAPGADRVYVLEGFVWSLWLGSFSPLPMPITAPHALKLHFEGLESSITVATGAGGFGASLVGLGDQNCDGFMDLMVGSSQEAATRLYSVAQHPLSPSPNPAWVPTPAISISTGGTHNFALDAGVAHANKTYLLLGCLNATAPGLPMGPGCGVLPLVQDGYFNFTLAHPNTPPLSGSLGILDATGQASASFTLPAGTTAVLPGTTVYHAYLALSSTGVVDLVSNATGTVIVP